VNLLVVVISCQGREVLLDASTKHFGSSSTRKVLYSDLGGFHPDGFEFIFSPAHQASGDYKTDCERDIGWKRRAALDLFLAWGGHHDYMCLLDDDIFVEEAEVWKQIEYFEKLKAAGLKPGVMTLHGTRSHHGFVTVKDVGVVSELMITGEANLLFEYESCRKIGNGFGPHPKGFGDTHFSLVREQGFKYYDVMSPATPIQHCGTEEHGGSVVYREEYDQPFWVTEPYLNEYPWSANHKKPLTLTGEN
jgi:hypothetical protein